MPHRSIRVLGVGFKDSCESLATMTGEVEMVESTARKPLEDYLSLQYPFVVHADPDGAYVIVYPDLPGCLSQAESLDEIPAMA